MSERRRRPPVPRLRVAFLLPALDIGGAERAVVRLASRLNQSRFEPVVAAFVAGTSLLRSSPEATGVRFETIAKNGTVRLAFPSAFAKWIRRSRPDVLLTYMFHANMAGRLARLVRLVPALVCSERVAGWESRARILLNRATVRLADKVTVNSRASQAFWAERLNIPSHEIAVIYNGVDLSAFTPVNRLVNNRPRIGVLARLHEANGHRWFIDALAQLNTVSDCPWTCTFAGDGPEYATLRDLVSERGLAERVVFTGHASDAVGFLGSIDVLVHPCLVSGMPNVVLEAMACGLPVVATAVGGTPEVIDEGKNGFLVRPGDVLGTSRVLHEVLTSPDMRRALGAAARDTVAARFSIEGAVNATEAVVADVVRNALALEYLPTSGWSPRNGVSS